MRKVGIIGGSGLYDMEGVEEIRKVKVRTPFGDPSDVYICGRLGQTDVVFLPRHDQAHRLCPSEINYRANIYGMKKLGVGAIVSVSACGSLKEELKPMDFVIPDQFLDRTSQRQSTFFYRGIVAHVSFAEPVCPQMGVILEKSAQELAIPIHRGGVYVNMEGPQFSTRAESLLYRSWGMDIIGMTNATEAKLAREAEIPYASLSSVTDYDCWHEAHSSVTMDIVIEYLNKNVANAKRILKKAVPAIAQLPRLPEDDALRSAIVTDKKKVSLKIRKDLNVIIGKYMNL
jgi:5'-methylthioadenosine phosphorylase